MLQEFGFIKYNKNFTFQKENQEQMHTHKSFYNRNMSSKINSKRKNISIISLKHLKNNAIPNRQDKIFRNEINNFIKQSTKNIEINPLNILKIKHEIDDKIIQRNNLMIPLNESVQNKTFFKVNDYSLYNLMKKKLQKSKNNSIINYLRSYNYLNNIESEINEKKIIIHNLEIKNASIENKINILKNEYNINLLKNTDISNSYDSDLINLKYMKTNTNINSQELSSLKIEISELKNQIIVNNKEQKIINLQLFKEKIENELNKEDINKMKKLNENINNEIIAKKEQISELRKKIKILYEIFELHTISNNLKFP